MVSGSRFGVQKKWTIGFRHLGITTQVDKVIEMGVMTYGISLRNKKK
jgi:hypothetical protein